MDSLNISEQPNELETVIAYFIDEEIEIQEQLYNSFNDS